MFKQAEIYHNSQELAYREPFGAVEAGSVVRLKLELDVNRFNIKGVKIRVWQDKNGETLLPMSRSEALDGKVCFTGDMRTTPAGCLMWYYFIIELVDGRLVYYGNNSRQQGGEGAVYDNEPPSYQVTVFDKGAKTPDWFKGTVMYQIFPDRFYRKAGQELAAKQNGVYHLNWSDKPYYYKDVDTKEIISYDFFGGNLAGIKEKLGYLKELGIGTIYLNPIFQAQSNHRYDTGDYHRVDPMLGNNADLAELCTAAEQAGIRIILDGVFSHTGSDSKYFNRYGNYDSVGAYQSEKSPYKEWYDFVNYPQVYQSWWGFDTLPNIKETMPSYMDFIIYEKNSVLKYWLKQGVSGWRLDVIDELPPEFSQAFYRELKLNNPDNVMIGEVWEDASNKQSYGVSREYLCGHEMDSAMNYPFRKAVLDFVLGCVDAVETYKVLLSLYENYPQENFYAMMNLLGSHDVERVLTLLGEAPSASNVPAVRQAEFKLSADKYELAKQRLKLASLWQMTFPGVPCIYYGDEIGMQGYRDPYNRCPYEWGQEDKELQAWYKQLIAFRNNTPALQSGDFKAFTCGEDIFGYLRQIYNGKDVFGRKADDDAYVVLFNRHRSNSIIAELDLHDIYSGKLECVLGEGENVLVTGGMAKVEVRPLSGVVYRLAIPSKFPRQAGVLLHPTSLPSANDIGDIGSEAYNFVDFLAESGQKLWQVLPLNPVAYGDSPYQSPSAFAGNAALISLEGLVKNGMLQNSDIMICKGTDFAAVLAEKRKVLKTAYRNFKLVKSQSYNAFCQAEAYWLEDYAVYMALKDKYQQPWYEWPEEIKQADKLAVKQEKILLRDKIDYYKFEQYIFFMQWRDLKAYANNKGISIIGDMPIFVAHDSADVWANQSEFQLDEAGRPEKVAGVPPDYFSATGQLWGNPHYDWEAMKHSGYKWWKNRFSCLLTIVDIIRVDHFRGFEAYWSIDGQAETAIDGEWVTGPGVALFKSLAEEFGTLPIIAEDLGVITDAVNELKDSLELPGMKILHFALNYRPDKPAEFSCSPNVIAYTGTHDNNTTVGWLSEDLTAEQQEAVGKMLGVDAAAADSQKLCRLLIEYLYNSNADTAIVPMQDILALGSSARMNLPGSVGGSNWHWRLPKEYAKRELSQWLAELVKKSNR